MLANDFVRKHPTAIVEGYIPFAEIVNKLKTKYHAVECAASEIPNLGMHRFNAVHLPSNETLRLTENQLQIKGIKIAITDTSRGYTVKNYVPVASSITDETEFIYLAYEEQVGYHYSNSNILFLEVALARGIPEEDIKNKTENNTCYLHYLQRYIEDCGLNVINDLPE